jgi:hypothetical protein
MPEIIAVICYCHDNCIMRLKTTVCGLVLVNLAITLHGTGGAPALVDLRNLEIPSARLPSDAMKPEEITVELFFKCRGREEIYGKEISASNRQELERGIALLNAPKADNDPSEAGNPQLIAVPERYASDQARSILKIYENICLLGRRDGRVFIVSRAPASWLPITRLLWTAESNAGFWSLLVFQERRAGLWPRTYFNKLYQFAWDLSRPFPGSYEDRWIGDETEIESLNPLLIRTTLHLESSEWKSCAHYAGQATDECGEKHFVYEWLWTMKGNRLKGTPLQMRKSFRHSLKAPENADMTKKIVVPDDPSAWPLLGKEGEPLVYGRAPDWLTPTVMADCQWKLRLDAITHSTITYSWPGTHSTINPSAIFSDQNPLVNWRVLRAQGGDKRRLWLPVPFKIRGVSQAAVLLLEGAGVCLIGLGSSRSTLLSIAYASVPEDETVNWAVWQRGRKSGHRWLVLGNTHSDEPCGYRVSDMNVFEIDPRNGAMKISYAPGPDQFSAWTVTEADAGHAIYCHTECMEMANKNCSQMVNAEVGMKETELGRPLTESESAAIVEQTCSEIEPSSPPFYFRLNNGQMVQTEAPDSAPQSP